MLRLQVLAKFEAVASMLATEAFAVIDVTSTDVKTLYMLRSVLPPMLLSYHVPLTRRAGSSRKSWFKLNKELSAQEFIRHSEQLQEYMLLFVHQLVDGVPHSTDSTLQPLPGAKPEHTAYIRPRSLPSTSVMRPEPAAWLIAAIIGTVVSFWYFACAGQPAVL